MAREVFELSRGHRDVSCCSAQPLLRPDLTAGKGSAYTLNVTTCDLTNAETTDTILFEFCQGGTYCTPTDFVEVAPHDGLGTVGQSIGVPVSVGYEPTTLVISNPLEDGW